jgi:hypothetical protein
MGLLNILRAIQMKELRASGRGTRAGRSPPSAEVRTLAMFLNVIC